MKPLLPFALLPVAFAGPAGASLPDPPVEIASLPVVILVDLGSNQILFSRQADLRFVPASMAKVMTAFVAFEEIAAGRLNENRRFIVTHELSREWKGKGASMHLEAGETARTHDLLQAIMTASANDAAMVLATGHAGSQTAWARRMNGTAARLGMKNSHFNTPNGWPDEGRTYVSARDLVTLTDAMISRYPSLYRAYIGKKTFVWKGQVLASHDPVTGVVAGADGIKTGYTREAGYNFLGSAKRGNRRLAMVVAGARSEEQRASAARAFLEWGFASWRERPLYRAGQSIAMARVQGGNTGQVELIAPSEINASIPRGGKSRITLRLIYRGPIRAPVAKGAEVAQLEISVDGMAPSRVPLAAATAIGKADLMDRLRNGLMSLIS